MDDHQDVDIVRDAALAFVDRLDLEGLLDLVHDRPGLLHAALHAEGAVDRQAGDQADDLLLHAQAVDQPGDVVFDEALAGRMEEGDLFFRIHRVGPGEAEIDHRSAGIDGHAFHAVGFGLVLVDRIGLGPVGLQPDLAVRKGGIALQQVAHPLRRRSVAGHPVDQRGREEQAQDDRLFEGFQHPHGSVGQGELRVLGQIDRDVAPCDSDKGVADKGVEGEQEDEGDDQGGDREAAPVVEERHRPTPPS